MASEVDDGVIGTAAEGAMQYIDVLWLHEGEEDPCRLVSELDWRRNEVRKLEFFRSGRVGFASARGAAIGTELGYVSVPELEEINADPQFKGRAIERTEFEELWQRHASPDA